MQPRLERALAGFVPAPMVGDAIAEALAYAWEHRHRVLPMTNPPSATSTGLPSHDPRRRKQGLLPWKSDSEIPDIEPGLPAALAPKQSQAIWLA